MNAFSYAYGYGKLEVNTRFLALDLLKEGLITDSQYKKVEKYIDDRVAKIKQETQEYSEATK
jgi:hypothetical protein